ncbi:hypothetical protein [Rahnella sp. PCH160]|uniref:hypothetical protein n=1 Tax=Rahnella sp. PCH160 TaxID=3447928 RepID=UPI0039FC9DF8
MKNLTLEKAQELLEFLKGKAADGDITMSQENYLQAMELAVMVLAAKPLGAMCEDGSAICFFDNREVQVQKVMHWIGCWPFYLYSTPPVQTVSFYRDGIIAAANWVDQSREAFECESGQFDPDTGSFEFSNDADREYSSILFDVAEGIRELHPNAVPDTIQKPFKDVSLNDVVPVGNDYFRVRYITRHGDSTTLHLQREAEKLHPLRQNDVIQLSVENVVPLTISVKAS